MNHEWIALAAWMGSGLLLIPVLMNVRWPERRRDRIIIALIFYIFSGVISYFTLN